MNNRGQIFMVKLMFLVMGVILFAALLPVISDSLKDLRGSDKLNCVSTKAVCGSSPEPCYNSSLETETTTCLIVNSYTPYIAVAVLVVLVMGLMAKRSETEMVSIPQY